MSFYKPLKNAARANGINASNRMIEQVIAMVERIQSAYDRPATIDDAIALGLKMLSHSDPTGETAIRNVMKEQAA